MWIVLSWIPELLPCVLKVENEEAEKIEMEVSVRGGVYNVSNVEGMAKITPKTPQNTDHAQDVTVVSPWNLIILLCILRS